MGARRWTALGVAGVAMLLLAACAGPGDGGTDPGGSPIGSWGSTDDREPNLALTEDGRLTGTDGCNRLTGGWTEADGVVAFEQVASTRMACQGVDTWLSELATAIVDGDELVVSDASGAEIGRLDRDD